MLSELLKSNDNLNGAIKIRSQWDEQNEDFRGFSSFLFCLRKQIGVGLLFSIFFFKKKRVDSPFWVIHLVRLKVLLIQGTPAEKDFYIFHISIVFSKIILCISWSPTHGLLEFTWCDSRRHFLSHHRTIKIHTKI